MIWPVCSTVIGHPWICKHFIQKRSDSAGNVGKSHIVLDYSTLWEVLSFWLDVSVHHLITSDSSDCFIIKVMCTHHNNDVHSTSDCSVPLRSSCWWISFGFSVSQGRLFWVIANLETRKTQWSDKRSDVRTGIGRHVVHFWLRKDSSLSIILWFCFMYTSYFVPEHVNRHFQDVLSVEVGRFIIWNCSPQVPCLVLAEVVIDSFPYLLGSWSFHRPIMFPTIPGLVMCSSHRNVIVHTGGALGTKFEDSSETSFMDCNLMYLLKHRTIRGMLKAKYPYLDFDVWWRDAFSFAKT